MLSLLLQVLLAATAVAREILLPKPSGKFDVSIRTSEIVDTSRSNGNYPNDNPNKPRRLMVSAFSPGCVHESCHSPYTSHEVSDFLLEYIGDNFNTAVDFTRYILPICAKDVTYANHYELPRMENSPNMPLILFSPGYGCPRDIYNVMNSMLASQGYLVLTIDHPYSSGVVKFPDGTILTQHVTNFSEVTKELVRHSIETRAADVKTVLDSITMNSTLATRLFPRVKPDYSKIAMWGHSFGGATTAQAMYEDKRIKGGINLDGWLFGSVVNHGFNRPFMLWQALTSRKTEPSWSKFWSHLTGFKKNIGLKRSRHFSYTDFELLADLYPFKAPNLIGKINGTRDIDILTAYSKDFFDFLLKGKKASLINGPSKEYPEVYFVP